jgi:hypothetical protein
VAFGGAALLISHTALPAMLKPGCPLSGHGATHAAWPTDSPRRWGDMSLRQRDTVSDTVSHVSQSPSAQVLDELRSEVAEAQAAEREQVIEAQRMALRTRRSRQRTIPIPNPSEVPSGMTKY